MSNGINEGINLREIIRKVGHQLEEIRLRALENILSKLRNQLICLEDLVHHRDLMINLLQWFNFGHTSKKGEVLDLLESLSKHNAAAVTLHSIGAVEFLSMLRQDLNEKEHLELIDNILNNLFWMHDEVQQENGTNEKVHLESISKPHTQIQGPLKTDCHVPVSEEISSIHSKTDHSRYKTPIEEYSYSSNDANANLDTSSMVSEQKGEAKSAYVTKWIVLTSSDRHILSVTESRLQSHSPALVLQSCEFLKDVLLHDFPAHIFIQRPNLVKTLLHLLEVHCHNNANIFEVLMSCLIELAEKLLHTCLQERKVDMNERTRVDEFQNSAEASVHTETSSLHSFGTSFNGQTNYSQHRTPSQDQDTRSKADDEIEDFESLLLSEALQQSQWTVLDFCLSIVSSSMNFLINAVQRMEESESLTILLNRVLEVLDLYDIRSIWSSSTSNRKIYDIMACLRKFSEALQLSVDTRDKCGKQSEYGREIEKVFTMLANITMLSVRFISITVPFDRIYEAVPESLLNSFKLIITDEILVQGYPYIRPSLLDVVKIAEEEFYAKYKLANYVISSMKKTQEFLEEMRRKDTKVDFASLLDLCEYSLPSVTFHSYKNFIKSTILLIGAVNKSKDIDRGLIKRADKILLFLLSHGNRNVQEMTYQISLDTITDALSVSHVTDPLSSSYQRAAFFVNPQVLEEVVCFGLNNQIENITNYSINILVNLLLGRLNMSPRLWQCLLQSISPVLAILQGFAVKDKSLQRALVNLTDTSNALLASDGEVYSLPPLEQLRASFRFMFTKDPTLRAKGFSSVVWLMTQEDNRNGNSIRYPFENVQNASEMFLVNPVLSAKYQNDLVQHKTFGDSQISQLWEVFTSSSVDESLRRSAAEQLVVLLQDPSWHKQLLEREGDKFIMKYLHSIVVKYRSSSIVSVDLESNSLLHCIKMLRYFTQFNPVVRHSLAMERSLYFDIMKSRILGSDHESIHYEASCLLMLLVFDEFFKTDQITAVSLPEIILKRYMLPFQPTAYQLKTEFREKTNKQEDVAAELIQHDLLSSMIRVHWNIILAGKARSFKTGVNEGDSNEFTHSLKLQENEATILNESLPTVKLSEHTNTIKQSDNTSVVISSIKDLKKYIVALICIGSAKHPNHQGGSFSDNFLEMVDVLKDDNILSRLFSQTSRTNRKSLLSFTLQLSQLLIKADSRLLLKVSAHLLRFMMNQETPFNEAVRNYALESTQQKDFQKNAENPYDISNENRIIFKDILRFIISISLKINTHEITQRPAYDIADVGNFISVLTKSLTIVDSSSYYDLPVLEITLDCLYHVTFKPGWSMQYNGSGEELCSNMATTFIQILHSFHVDRIGAATSFMGKGVMAKAALCLCHVAKENLNYSFKDWTSVWVRHSENSDEPDGLPWLISLLDDHVLDIRWAGWSLATGLLNGPIGSQSVVNEFQIFPGGVWASAVGVLLDNFENSLIRNQACILLLMLLRKLEKAGGKSEENILWDDMVVQDTNSKAHIKGFPAFLLLLDHFQFFKKVMDIMLPSPQKQTSSSNMNTVHNVSTSCSTPATATSQDYRRMFEMGVEGVSNGSSSNASNFGSERKDTDSDKTNDLQDASLESLLPSVSISLSQSSQSQERVYRMNIKNIKSVTEHCAVNQPDVSGCSSRLKSSVFKLICALVQLDNEAIITSLENEGLVDIAIGHVDEDWTKNLALRSQNFEQMSQNTEISVHEDAEMIKNILLLLNLVVNKHLSTAEKLRCHTSFTRGILSLFDFSCGSDTIAKSVNDPLFGVWAAALRILHKLCCDEKSLKKSKLEDVVIQQLQSLIYVCCHTLKSCPSSETSKLFLIFFKSILCRELRREKKDRYVHIILDTTPENVADGIESTSTKIAAGENLCQTLLDITCKSKTDELGRIEAVSCLSALFAVSQSSKTFAVGKGFMESIVEDIKDIHVKLNLASLQLERECHGQRKEKPLMLELARIFDVLRNLVYCSQDAKDAAIDSGLIYTIQKIWSWCLIDRRLKISLLELLCTLTANCSKAHDALCSGSSPRTSADEAILFPSILKLLVKLHEDCMAPTGKIDASTRLAFQLVTNLAVSSDCRGQIWKNNFYQHFNSSQIGQSANKKQKAASRILSALWIQFLLVVSFFNDGAQAVLKVNGMLPTLIDFASEEHHRERSKALLILRNLICFPANKPTLVTNSILVNCLLKALDVKSIWSKRIVISSFASLLDNCHKAKVTLKRTKLLARLQLIQEDVCSGKLLSEDGNLQGYQQLKNALQKTLKALSD